MPIPQGIKVELALTTTPDDPAPVWTDITSFVELQHGITITRGRQDEFGHVQPGTLTLTLNNTSGRFTAGLTTGAYYPNIKVRKKIRVTTLAPSAVSSRFTGYVDEWPVAWVGGSDQFSVAQITAVDRFKRLGRLGQLSNLISEEYFLDNPAAYYTLGEPATAVTVGDTSALGTAVGQVAQTGTGGTITFAASTGPGTDGMSSPLFARVDASNGKYLTATPSAPLSVKTFECFVNTSTLAKMDLVQMRPGSGSDSLGLYLSAAGKGGVTAAGSGGWFLETSGTVANGATRHLAVTSGPGLLTSLYVDGVLAATDSSGIVFVALDQLTIGGGNFGPFNGTISHAAVYTTTLSAARILAHAQAGLTGFVGERSDQRIARYASYAGIPTAEQALEVGLSTSIAHYDTTGKDPLTAMRDITATESGVLQMDGAGKLAFHARSHRYNTAISLTIPGKDIGPDARFILNDSQAINDVTASRPDGITYRSTDAASITEYGVGTLSLTLYVTTDNEVINAADWNAHQYSTSEPRLPNLMVDILSNTGIAASVLGLDVGSRITVNALPAQAPAPSVDLFIEGWREVITPDAWQFTFNTSPESQSNVWQLDSATYSQLGVSTRLGY